MAEVKLEDLKPNSHIYKNRLKEDAKKEPSKKLEPVVKKDSVVRTKKPIGKKLSETFLKEDINDVKEYIIFDAIIPGVKNLCLDALEMFFFGSVSGRDRRDRRDDRSRTSYSSMYKRKEYSRSSRRDRDEEEYEVDDKTDYQDIVLRYSDDAKDVVDQLRGRIHEYGQVSIADLFDLVNIAGKYTDNNWGWTNEGDIGIRRVKEGYLIDVKPARLLD